MKLSEGAVFYYTFSVFGGYWLVGAFMHFMRSWIIPNHKETTQSKRMVFFVGATERLVATTLIIFAPAYLAPFIGGWVALKYAANWQKKEETNAREHSLFAMIGTVLSFAIAIGAGLFINNLDAK
jgi:hypothetical protein